MIKQRRIRAALALAALSSLAYPAWLAAQEKPALSLKLDDCIVQAVKRNLGVAVQVYSIEMADLAVSRSREKFLPTLGFDFGKQDQNSASYSWIDAADKVTTNYQNYGGSFSQAVPFGGNFSVSLDRLQEPDQCPVPDDQSPLWKHADLLFHPASAQGFRLGHQPEGHPRRPEQPRHRRKRFQDTLLDTVYSVEQTYWQLVLSIESLKVRQQSLKLAEDLFDQNQQESQDRDPRSEGDPDRPVRRRLPESRHPPGRSLR